MDKSTIKKRKHILSFLKREQIRNMNAIYFMEDYNVHSLEQIGNSVLLRGESDRPWVYISSTDPEELNLVKASLTGDDRCFAAIEEWMVPILTRDKAVKWDLSMMRWILRRTPLPFPRRDDVEVLPLMEDDARFIYDNSPYKEFTSPGYIRERIRKGPNGGIYKEGKLVAWAMTHDDGSIGITNVLPGHRRKGYAHALTAFLVNRVRERGRIPYLHIEEANVEAMNVVASLGFQWDQQLHWFEVGPN